MCNLAKYLDTIIKPVMPGKYSINSNRQFLNNLNSFQHETGDYCISFDVTSLFTNIPLEETLQLVVERLYSEDNPMKPPMPKSSMMALLECATGGIFTYKENLYQQTDGVSMGNPLAPTLANLFMGNLEENHLFTDSLTSAPAIYMRYVDDVFCIFRKNVKFELFYDQLQSLHKNIKFTYEFGGNSLPFLDTRIDLGRNTFESKIHRKSTDTNVLLNYSAVAPPQWKRALITWFINRAKAVCTTDIAFREEIVKLVDIFGKNGYPKRFIDKVVNNFSNGNNNSAQRTQDQNYSRCLKVPYVGRPSYLFAKRAKRLFNNCLEEEIKVVYSTTKVGDSFRLKDLTPKHLRSDVVYEFKCLGDPGTQYIGYTSRSLGERAKEHLKGGTRISDHIGQCTKCINNNITVDNFNILKNCRNKTESMIYEALLIKRFNPKLNLQLVKPGITHQLKIFN